MSRIVKDTVKISVSSGSSSNTKPQRLVNGNILAVIVSPSISDISGKAIRIKITDNANNELVKLVNIKQLRSREVAFENDGYPVDFTGGQDVNIEIIADDTFTSNFNADVLFVYENNLNKTSC